MNQVPFIPDNAPFTAEQRLWLNGYLAGLFSNAGGDPASRAATESITAPIAPRPPLLVLFGSQTGTAEGVAKKAAKTAEARGFAPRVVCLDKFESVDLAKEERVLVITSTYGDGDPPDNAQGFWNWLSGDTAPRLEQTHFSVLALGDTNYAAFCEFGRKCDARLEALGAKRLAPRVDCDVDHETPASSWADGVFTAARIALSAVAPTPLFVPAAGAALVGQPVSPAALEAAAEIAQAAATPISDMRGTAAYRKHLCAVMTRRALETAVARAQEN